METAGSPTFLGNPKCASALLSDPGRLAHTRPLRCSDAAPAVNTAKATDDSFHFGAQSHGFDTRCLRFAGQVTPTRRKTRFRPPARLYRTGFITRRVPLTGF